MGYSVRISTLPTGKDWFSWMARPSREPAQTTWYSGAFSQKYFSAVIARGHSWISSKMISVLPGVIVLPRNSPSSNRMRFTS